MKSAICIVALSLVSFAALRAESASRASVPAKQQPAAASPAPPQPEEGDALFATHCARCHMPPMTLSQRTTGTVIMHMRVRARLSTRDQQLLLRYLAP